MLCGDIMKTIEHTHTLVYYDGVQVFAGRDADGRRYIGIMIDTAGTADRYLVTAVGHGPLREFYAGTRDLRSLLLESSAEGWYIAFVSDGFEQPVSLEQQQGSLLATYLPEPGFRLRGAPLDELMNDDPSVSTDDLHLIEDQPTEKTISSTYRRKLIEVDLPLDAINAESAREKSIRHGHPSTLHLWWARRPLAACRAVIFASLVDDPIDYPDDEFPADGSPIEEKKRAERQRLHEIIKRLVKWESSNDPNLLAEARYEIAKSVARSSGETAPTHPDDVLEYLNRQAKPIYDPFCGGGSIPLEAQRLGLRTVGSDLNPVAVLITKALIELPPKFANRPPVNPEADPLGIAASNGKNPEPISWRGAAGLAADIRYYGLKMREMAWEKIGHLYPEAPLPNGGNATAIAWLWARTVPCPNPACGFTMPLLKTFLLSRRSKFWINPVADSEAKQIRFTVQSHAPNIRMDSTVNRNRVTCLACNGVVDLTYVSEQARAGHIAEQMTAIVAEGDRNRLYLPVTNEQVESAEKAVPQWKPPQCASVEGNVLRPRRYGTTHWHQLFTNRQLTALTTLSDLLPEVHNIIKQDGGESTYANAVVTYLAFAIDRTADSGCSYARWQNSGDKVAGVFSRQRIAMMWDFAEANPFSSSTQKLDGTGRVDREGSRKPPQGPQCRCGTASRCCYHNPCRDRSRHRDRPTVLRQHRLRRPVRLLLRMVAPTPPRHLPRFVRQHPHPERRGNDGSSIQV